jgi:hypothetical protein
VSEEQLLAIVAAIVYPTVRPLAVSVAVARAEQILMAVRDRERQKPASLRT